MTPQNTNGLRYSLPNPKNKRIEVALSEPRSTIRIIDSELLIAILSNETVSPKKVLLGEYNLYDGIHELDPGFKNKIEGILIQEGYEQDAIIAFTDVLELRLSVVERVAHIKSLYEGTPPKDQSQWIAVLTNLCELARDCKINHALIVTLWNDTIHKEALRIEKEIIDSYHHGQEDETEYNNHPHTLPS